MWNTYVAIGDSIAEGWGDLVDGYNNIGWVPLLTNFLKDHAEDLKYYNYGWRGATVNEVINTQVNRALKHDPDLITVTVGANDALTNLWDPIEFKEEYTDLIQIISNNERNVILMTYPRLNNIENQKEIYHSVWQLYFTRISEVNEIIREIGNRFNFPVLEMEAFEELTNLENLSQDLVHPNSRGYKFAAEYIINKISEFYSL